MPKGYGSYIRPGNMLAMLTFWSRKSLNHLARTSTAIEAVANYMGHTPEPDETRAASGMCLSAETRKDMFKRRYQGLRRMFCLRARSK